jgi:hypothetical protein
MAPFLAPSLAYDHAVIEGFTRESRWDTVVSFDVFFDGGAEELSHDSPYLDPSGVAYATSVDFDDWPDYTMLELLEMDEGAATTMWHARASSMVEGWDYGADDSPAETLARRYLAAYAAADVNDLAALYSDDATVTDRLLGLSITSTDPRALLDSTPTMTLDLQSAHHTADATASATTPAVYIHRPYVNYYPIDQVWLLATSEDECPGALAIVLDVDEEMTITAERRLHSLESARRCFDPADIADGWWSGASLPEPFDRRVTGTVTSGAGQIEIRNGCPELDASVRQALGLFSSAGLEAPRVGSITFNPYNDECADHRGYADWSAGGDTAIRLCMDEDTAHWTDQAQTPDPTPGDEPDAASQPPPTAAGEWNLLLHELAHAWMRTHLDDDDRAEIVDMTGSSSWNDHDDPWARRGVEWGAEAVRWGILRDPGTTIVKLDSPDCATLSGVYEAVTGVAPPLECDGAA